MAKKVDLEWKKKFLRERLDDSWRNLEWNCEDEEGKKYFEYEIKTLKSWIEQLGTRGTAKDNEFTEWKIDFLQNHNKCLRMIIEEEESLNDEDREDFEEEIATVDKYIQEIKAGEI